jgi:hypothetical protein
MVAIVTQIAPIVPERPAVCAQLSAIALEGRPVGSNSTIISRPAVLPEPVPITSDVRAVLADIVPEVPAISRQSRTVALRGHPVGSASGMVSRLAGTLVHLSDVLGTRPRDPQGHCY